jgi:hypothetical protein
MIRNPWRCFEKVQPRVQLSVSRKTRYCEPDLSIAIQNTFPEVHILDGNVIPIGKACLVANATLAKLKFGVALVIQKHYSSGSGDWTAG